MRGTTEKQAPTLPVQWVYDEVIHNQKGDSDMTKEEAIEILKNGGWWDLLIPITTIEGRSDEGKLHQAIDMAITALHSMPEAGEPLSLEQLREMDGKPVWIEDLQTYGLASVENNGTWEGVPFVIFTENGTKFTYNIEERGLKIYPYPPAHIDRSKWEPCEFCNGKTVLYQHTNSTKLFMNTFGKAATLVTECNACPPYADCCMKDISANSAFRIKFCPECGRPLTEEAWAELERRLME